MPQEFSHNRSAAASIRHIAQREIDGALKAIDGAGDTAAAVHAVRQRLKRLRALIRLPRGHFAGYSAENTAFRDLGRKLSATREADVLGETLDKLVQNGGLAPVDPLRDALLAAHPARQDTDVRERLADEVRPGLEEAHARAADWQFTASGFDLLGQGVEATYRAMRSAGLEASAETDAAHLHEWRKQVKHHAAQLRYLMPVAPDWLGPRRQSADALADILGEHHDLDVLASATAALPEAQRRGADAVNAAIAARSTTLELEAFRLRDVLADQTPAALRALLAEAWDDWRA